MGIKKMRSFLKNTYPRINAFKNIKHFGIGEKPKHSSNIKDQFERNLNQLDKKIKAEEKSLEENIKNSGINDNFNNEEDKSKINTESEEYTNEPFSLRRLLKLAFKQVFSFI